MSANIKGWVYLICAAVIFAVFCWIATQHELRLEDKLEAARQKIEDMDEAHKAAIESLQAAHKAQEQIRDEIDQRKDALAGALDRNQDWSSIAIDPDVLGQLCREGAINQAYCFQPSERIAGGCEDTGPDNAQNSGRHGAADSGGRAGDAPQKR